MDFLFKISSVPVAAGVVSMAMLEEERNSWPVKFAGVQLREAGGAVLRREPWDGHPRSHRRHQPPPGRFILYLVNIAIAYYKYLH
jgi:hypothetical protein